MTSPGETAARGGAPSQADVDARAIAAFDFDGTLSTRDSFTAFLRWRTSFWRWAIGLIRLLPAGLAYLATRDRGRMKSAGIRVFLEGLPREQLRKETAAFAASKGDGLLRPDALAAWEAHRLRGDLAVIVTASPEEVVAPFAERLKADALIASRLAWTHDDRVGPGLAGANCRGPEKVVRLKERFGRDVEVCDAYGDTSGDREMLALARRGHLRRFVGHP